MSKITRTIATLLLLAFFALPAQAQESPLKIGLRGGFAQSTVYGDDVAQSDYRPGFSGGLFATYVVNDAFSIQPEVLYTVKGGKNIEFEGTTSDLRWRLDYIQVPVLLKLSAPLNGVITPRLYVGPQVSFLVGAEQNGVDVDDSLKSVDFGGVAGGEIGLDVSSFTGGVLDEIALDARYGLGLVALDDTAGELDVKNGTFTSSLSLRFGL
ncbi:porin family protein [Salisaeta longa]|uniref:porin family protein n=1 Tax=Salisaeta longa TaxID=503170 RepID=UPI0003B610EF|nr:porin family protein [Salisaeta longa]